MAFKTVKDIENLRGMRELLRLDLNVPIIDGVLLDDFRVKKSMPTLNFFRESGAKTIIISHIENPDTKSLKTAGGNLSKYFNFARF